MININVNISDIHNFQLQAQQLPSHQLNTNLILVTSNIPQNFINTTHEDTFLELMINSLDHWINILNNLKDAPIHSCDNNNEDGFEKEQKYILIDTMVQNILSFE